MRLAVVGKGGAGKSFITGTLARLRGLQGRRVLAVDLDVNPGLALSLGIPVVDYCLDADAVETAPPDIPYGFDMRAGLTPEEAVERYGVDAPNGVRFLQIGNVGKLDHGLQRFVVAVRRILRGFRKPGWDVIADIEAGPMTPYEGYVDFADTAWIVIEPTWTSTLAARRIASVLRETGPPVALLGNKVRSQDDIAVITEAGRELNVPVVGMLPFDAAVANTERAGRAPMDVSASSPAIESLRILAAAQ